MFARIAAFGILLLSFLGWSAVYWPVQAGQDSKLEITAPAAGDALQGVVGIYGTTGVAGFQNAEISFGYQDDPTETWFLIDQGSQPVEDNLLATWDTSTITDGEYKIRIVVFLNGGQVLEVGIDHLRVRNYSPVETNTPDPHARSQGTPTPTRTAWPDYQPRATTPTPLPTNSAELTPADLSTGAMRGALAVVAALAISGAYLGLRALFHRR